MFTLRAGLRFGISTALSKGHQAIKALKGFIEQSGSFSHSAHILLRSKGQSFPLEREANVQYFRSGCRCPEPPCQAG
ncbi:hypothetical protein KSC_005120 [Ktedonobacter sp. SOSP1-52]|nr:hypothetical protein KSC_005120 [Ktedonobacter sp. SOSP1-52]